MNDQTESLKSFYSAFELLVRTAKKTVNSINEDPSQLVKFCNIIQNAKVNRIHLVGMGRSGKVGMLFGEMLKNIGYEVSYLGKSLAKPVRENDVVIGVTGSGWTNFTTKAIQNAILRKAKILVFTGDEKSLAARLADSIIIIPRGYVKPGSSSTSLTEKANSGAPLTPLGTLFEMTTMSIAFGIISGLREDSIVKGFNEGINNILTAVDSTLKNIKENETPLQQFIYCLESYSSQPERNVFIFGSGLDSIIASISSIRLSHLGVHIKSTYDWRFRQKGDILISISGSGVSSRTLERVKSAKASKMKVLGLTSFSESLVAKESDLLLEIEGRHEEVSADFRQISDMSIFVPSFEYAAAITLDSCVAQIASNSGITEEFMRAEHANIE
ncbi:MAG: SIS domain-containing protein [Candidatus Hodarchaeales archaeon]|jgi:6-phospho-3-hexuloisomerase